jgi:hypothetical protein
MQAHGVPCLVLAGRPNCGPLRQVSDAPWEALIDVAGQPMAARVIQALAKAQGIAGGVVVGPRELEETFQLPPGFWRVDPGEDVLDNVGKGLSALPGPEEGHILVATSDIPLLSAPAVEGFLRACQPQDQDVYLPVVPREVAQARFPGVQRTYVRLADGAYTMGNLVLVRRGVLRRQLAGGPLRQLVAGRKVPWKLALTVGPGMLLHYLMGRLSLERAATLGGRAFGVTGRAVVTADAEVGVDVDKVSDLVLCREVLSHVSS